jgi:hypothetical protein
MTMTQTTTTTTDNRTDRDRLADAFKALRRQGYLARANFSCCGSCGSYELGERLAARPALNGYVFWNRQSNDAFKQRGRRGLDENLHSTLYLAWSGDAAVLVAALRAEGLTVEHDGTEARCIEVKAQAQGGVQ